MICIHVLSADDNFIAAIRPGQTYGENSSGITKECVPDMLQNLFVRQKIVAEMWPVVAGIGHRAGLPIFAGQWKNLIFPHHGDPDGMSLQQLHR
ncbi:hypothetical protein DIE19_33650 [Burkholderia sp. Bp9126]|nr:hypothetical protein DIE19_33650 [Burkholderia sp. Bp9126]